MDTTRTLDYWSPDRRAERGEIWLKAHCVAWNYSTNVPRCNCTNQLTDNGDIGAGRQGRHGEAGQGYVLAGCSEGEC